VDLKVVSGVSDDLDLVWAQDLALVQDLGLGMVTMGIVHQVSVFQFM
jgi:hypothetical protein